METCMSGGHNETTAVRMDADLMRYLRTGEISAQVQQILEAVNDSYTKPREFDSTELGD
jgi:hypothetical protein